MFQQKKVIKIIIILNSFSPMLFCLNLILALVLEILTEFSCLLRFLSRSLSADETPLQEGL